MNRNEALAFVRRHEVVILDLCHTFMFECDRFSDPKSFSKAYREIGGTGLSDIQVESTINRVFTILHETGRHPENYDNFPKVGTVMAKVASESNIPENELERLVEVFAQHEVGIIPNAYAEVLVELSKNCRLGLLSNIWVKKAKYVQELKRASVDSLFENIVFSSDHGMLKPSRKLFDIVVEPFEVDCSRIVYIGDSYERDVAGAKGSGVVDTKFCPV